MQIRWQGGATETVEVALAPSCADVVRYRPEFVARVATDYDDGEIATEFNRNGLTSSTGKHFTASMISWIRFKHRIPGPSCPAGTLSVTEVRERYGVSHWVVYDWVDKGLVMAHRRKPGLPYAITAEIDRKLHDLVANSTRMASSSQIRTEQGAL